MATDTTNISAIPLDKLQSNVQPLNIPQLPQDTTNYQGIISGITNDYQQQLQDVNNLTASTTAANNDLTKTLSNIAGIPQMQTSMEQQAGLAQKKQDVQNATNEMNRLAAEANIIPLEAQQQALGRGVTEAGLAPLQTAALRENTIQTLRASAMLQAKQGNLALAQDQIDKAINLKYKQEEANLAVQKQIYQNNKDTLERVDKKRADALAFILQEREKQIADQKANEKAINDALINVGKYRDIKGNPAPQSVIDSIKNAKDPMTATLVSLPYLNDPLERQKKLEDMANARAKASKEGVTSTSLAKNMPNQNLINAINTGKIDPNKVNSRTIGIMNTLADAQVDAVGASAGSQARSAAVKTIYGQVSQARRVTAVLDKNMPLLYDLADKVNTTNTPALDRIIAGAQTYTGNNPDVIRYVNTIKTIRSEYAQMLARGGEVTESQRADAAEAIPTGLSGQGYREIGSQLQMETKNIIDAGNETYSAVLNPSSVPTHQGYTLPSGNGSYKGFTLPH